MMLEKFGNSQFPCLLYQCDWNRVTFWDFPLQKWLKNLGIPMSSLPLRPKKSDFFLISHCKSDWKIWEFPCLLYPCDRNRVIFFGFPTAKVIEKFGNSHVFFTLATEIEWFLGGFPTAKVIEKFGNSHVFFTLATEKEWFFGGFPTAKIEKFGNSHVFFTLATEIEWFFWISHCKSDWKIWEFPCLLYPCDRNRMIFLGFPNAKCGKKIGIPMSSLGGCH